VYFPSNMVQEVNKLAEKLDRSKSWILQKAWELAKRDLQKFNSPYPKDLIMKFQRTVGEISRTTQDLNEEDLEELAVSSVKKVRQQHKGRRNDP